MSLNANKTTAVSDLQLKKFIDVLSESQRFQNIVHELTERCWDICVDRPTARLEPKTEKCLVNCIERFIDTTNYITNRFEKIALSSDSSFDSE